MGFLDRVGMRWLLLAIALVPMSIASLTAVRLSSLAAEDERLANAELDTLDRLIALGDYHTAVVNETASYKGWTEAVVPSDVDLDSPQMGMARIGLIALATQSANEATTRLASVDLGESDAEIVERIEAHLDAVRSAFADQTEPDLRADLAAIDVELLALEELTDRLVDRRSPEWTVVDLHAEMMGRLSNEVFIVGSMLIAGESDTASRRDGALLVSQTDETFNRLLESVDPEERASLEAAFTNQYTTELRHGVSGLPDRFEPLSVSVIASAPADLERFGTAAEAVRTARAQAIHDDAAERAGNASRERLSMLAVAVLAIVVPAALLIVVGRRITRRLDELTSAAKRLSEGELGVRTNGVGGSDELALLADTFNDVSATVSLGHDQISALADGRLSDPVLDEHMPGPVGHTMRVALRRLGTATAELAHHASHDRLTGLLDRRGFHLAHADLTDHIEWAVMLVDLDGFKAVNDSFGHAAGDDVLTTIATRLSTAVRSGDAVARLGGDEFAAFVALDSVDAVADRMLLSLAEPMTIDGHPHGISASIGWTPLVEGEELGAALKRADAAMYEAKRAGHNRICSSPVASAAGAGPLEVRSSR